MENKEKLFTLRVLSGEMSGSELLLAEKRYLIKAPQKTNDNCHENVKFIDEYIATLFIPGEFLNKEYYLDLNEEKTVAHDDNKDKGYIITERSSDQGEPLFTKFNHITHIGNIALAIKEQSDSWSEEIINYVGSGKDSHNVASTEKESRKRDKKNINKLIVSCITVIILLSMTLGIWLKFTISQSEQTVTQSLATAISGSINPVDIIKSKQGVFYLLVKTQQDLDWVLQALERNRRREKIKPILLLTESERLVNKFWSRGYQVLTIDLSQPLQPLLKMVAEPATTEQLRTVKALALQWIPFADDVIVETYNKERIINSAQENLKKTKIPFTQISTPQGTTFTIQDSLSDSELFEVNQLINTHTASWGARYITFNVKLENNFLTGNSYLNGQQGYILLDKNHWYFPESSNQ